MRQDYYIFFQTGNRMDRVREIHHGVCAFFPWIAVCVSCVAIRSWSTGCISPTLTFTWVANQTKGTKKNNLRNQRKRQKGCPSIRIYPKLSQLNNWFQLGPSSNQFFGSSQEASRCAKGEVDNSSCLVQACLVAVDPSAQV